MIKDIKCAMFPFIIGKWVALSADLTKLYFTSCNQIVQFQVVYIRRVNTCESEPAGNKCDIFKRTSGKWYVNTINMILDTLKYENKTKYVAHFFFFFCGMN